jgi:hypothetical protein
MVYMCHTHDNPAIVPLQQRLNNIVRACIEELLSPLIAVLTACIYCRIFRVQGKKILEDAGLGSLEQQHYSRRLSISSEA